MSSTFQAAPASLPWGRAIYRRRKIPHPMRVKREPKHAIVSWTIAATFISIRLSGEKRRLENGGSNMKKIMLAVSLVVLLGGAAIAQTGTKGSTSGGASPGS